MQAARAVARLLQPRAWEKRLQLTLSAASGLPRDRFVFHCFSGSDSEARRVLDFGAWISFTGIVTYRNAPEVQAAAKLMPDDRIMAETDAPFLSPEPMRTAKPNRPAHVMLVVKQLAALRHEGLANLPVCIAKTPYSFSTDPSLRGAPRGHRLNIREVRLAAGARFVVMICGSVLTLGRSPLW